MRKIWTKLKTNIAGSGSMLSIIITYNIVNVIVAVAFYPLIPIILNYAPGMIEGGYDTKWMGISYTEQYVFIVSVVIIIGIIYLYRTLKSINKWETFLEGGENESKERINAVRKKCLDAPNLIYIFQITIAVAIITFIDVMLIVFANGEIVIMIKTILVFFSFGTLTALISLIFSRRIFRRILLETYKGQLNEGMRVGLKNKIFMQILPAFIVAIIFTSLLGYSRLIEEKGRFIFELYKSQLESIFEGQQADGDINQINENLNKLKVIDNNVSRFIVTPERQIITSDGLMLGDVFENYMYELSDNYNGRVFAMAGETQGAVLKIKNDMGEWIVGVKYDVATNESLTFFLVSFMILLILNVFVLFYFSTTLAEDLSLVTRSLAEIAKGGDIDLDKKLAVVSNDEIGDLVISFNKIQEREKENIKSMQQKQVIIMEQERLASLGQLIGGIAHNIKTPIMSISGGIEGLKELVHEYEESIDSENVTSEDNHEIAQEMLIWLEKMKPHCSYMSDVISAVKGQAVQLIASSPGSFTLDELIKRIDILMKHELIKNNCTMNKDFQADLNTKIKGEVNSMVQIFDNIIVNAIQAYGGSNGEIGFKIIKKGHDIEFIISDNAKGIPEELKNRLFKEMVTTKGKDGTGLGLYMSYSTIKGRFGGDIRFTSTEGKGTTFFVSIPFSREGSEQGGYE